MSARPAATTEIRKSIDMGAQSHGMETKFTHTRTHHAHTTASNAVLESRFWNPPI